MFIVGDDCTVPTTATASIGVQTDDNDHSGIIRLSHDTNNGDSLTQMSDDAVLLQLQSGAIKQHELERRLHNDLRAVHIRRRWLCDRANIGAISSLPYRHYDYSYVSGACCENVIGYVNVPVGYAGPLKINDRDDYVYVPLATTEGCLVASVNRGFRAIMASGGIFSKVHNDGMTRAPVVEFPNAKEAFAFKEWIENANNYKQINATFTCTSRYIKLKEIQCRPVGRIIFLRFVATTGDAMGMNMVTKATEAVMDMLQKHFNRMDVISLSGNYCVDKKASAINFIEGRGKSVIAEAVISAPVVESLLKTNVDRMVEATAKKLLIGSSMACTIGGNNAQAANIVAAIFIATGQDAAQVVSSSMCLTTMERTNDGDLRISCTMPCLEVGTIGGGTILPAQRTCLELMKCAGGNINEPGRNAVLFAETICATVLAGELSLMAAQCSGDLVKSHMRLNRSQLNLTNDMRPTSSSSSTYPTPVDSFSHTSRSSLDVRIYYSRVAAWTTSRDRVRMIYGACLLISIVRGVSRRYAHLPSPII